MEPWDLIIMGGNGVGGNGVESVGLRLARMVRVEIMLRGWG